MDCEANKYNLLEQMLLDSNKEPTDLPLSLLKAITNNFSEDQKIGSGGFADVYEGRLANGGSVAVKRLSQAINMDENNFNKEVTNLMRVKHQNVVRFLGYCADTQGKVEKYGGKMVVADVQQRLLCFEFLPNGCLDEHLNNVASGGLEWRTYYQIIKGLCQGLDYLHQQNIVHLDLKPGNILLDCNMVPKISDFGLSRCFDEKQTRAITAKVVGTLGYMAPEFISSGVITIKSDIYSLGIIIIEILTGQKGYLQTESVLENWSTRFQISHGGLWLEHARVCAKIGLECMDSDPVKRPITRQIIERLDELECRYGFIETRYGFIKTKHWAIPVLDVYPLDIWFPFESDKVIKCPVTLTNKTGNCFWFWIAPTSLDACSNLSYPYVWEHPDYDMETSSLQNITLGPHSSATIYMTMMKQEQPPLEAADKGMFDVVMVNMDSEKGRLLCVPHRYDEDTLTRARMLGAVVPLATLRAAVTSDPARWQEVAPHQFIQATPPEGEHRDIYCMDVHPTKTWLLVAYKAEDVYVFIWNYETQERVTKFEVKYLKEGKYINHISSIKFIAGEQWFAAGDDIGGVHVYAHTNFRAENDKVKEFEAHNAVNKLAVFPKHTLLLTASFKDKSIKLWDWSQGWTCVRVIDTHRSLDDLSIGPRDASTFAGRGYDYDDRAEKVWVWDIHSPDAIATFKIEGGCLTFCTNTHREFQATIPGAGGKDCFIAKIWDWRTKKHVHTLRSQIWHCSLVNLASHPTLPILAGIMKERKSKVHQIVLWDVRTYRVMKRIELLMEGDCPEMVFDRNEDITSLVVASDKEISIIKINVHAYMLLTGC